VHIWILLIVLWLLEPPQFAPILNYLLASRMSCHVYHRYLEKNVQNVVLIDHCTAGHVAVLVYQLLIEYYPLAYLCLFSSLFSCFTQLKACGTAPEVTPLSWVREIV